MMVTPLNLVRRYIESAFAAAQRRAAAAAEAAPREYLPNPDAFAHVRRKGTEKLLVLDGSTKFLLVLDRSVPDLSHMSIRIKSLDLNCDNKLMFFASIFIEGIYGSHRMRR